MPPQDSLIARHDALVAQGLRQNDPAQRPALAALDDLRQRVDHGPAVRGGVQGLYLWGDVGRGKSMLMDMFLQACATPQKRRVHFDRFMHDLHANLHMARRAGGADPVAQVTARIARGLRVLAFDEMQVSDIADAVLVRRVFAGLFDTGVTIVTTSNRAPADLCRSGLNRDLFQPLTDLLHRRLEVIHLPGTQDHRRARAPGVPVYFHPDTPDTTAALDRLWAGLTGGQAQPLTLVVQGRDLVLPAHHDRMLRLTFDQACDQPRSPAEYLALAAAARLVMLTGVPRLAETRIDAARRFVTLVDACYEAGVVLILGAAAPPQALYPQGEVAFEFRRLVSRLHEMQGATWLDRAGLTAALAALSSGPG